jgi:hypothetical protein
MKQDNQSLKALKDKDKAHQDKIKAQQDEIEVLTAKLNQEDPSPEPEVQP